MERIFEADTREEANRKADEWWAKAKGVRFIHRCQIPAGSRSNPSKRWVIAINYKEEASPS
jgi:predicted RNase H-like HicB family nuclease